LLGIHPLAGTTELGSTPSQQWESDAVDLSNLRQSKNADNKSWQSWKGKLGITEKNIFLIKVLSDYLNK